MVFTLVRSQIEFRGGGLPDGVTVVAIQGREQLSRPCEFEIWLRLSLAAAASLDLDSVLGERATLVVKAAEDLSDEWPYHGILREIELVHATAVHALLRVTLVPDVYKLSHSRRTRAFTFKKLDAVIDDVLGRAKLAMPWSGTSSEVHPEQEYLVQYRESDLAFLARWMEREGSFYYFAHGPEGCEELRLVDSSLEAESLGLVRYRPVAGADTSAAASLTSFRALESVQPTRVLVHDYDHARPALTVAGDDTVEDRGGDVVLFGERSFSPDDTKRLASLRAQEFAAAKTTFVGTGTVFGLRPGYVVELEQHPRLSGKYLIVRVEHRAAQGLEAIELAGLALSQGYEVSIECIPAEVPYRPSRRAPWPRVHGCQLGAVDGPADSDYAQLDDEGCYLVKLFVDESDLAGDKVSTRIRMMQPHAGSPEGWHFPLRKGTEVVVQFLGGDVDRPVIVGAVPNAVTPSVVTSANATQNVLQTGGRTRLEIEDEKGKQFIWVHTPPADTYLNLGHPVHGTHNITLHTDKDGLYDIGSHQLIEVGGELDEQVGSDVTETYSKDQTSTITGPQKTTVDKAVSEVYLSTQTTTVTGKPRTEIFDNGQLSNVLGAREEKYSASQTQQVLGTTDETRIGGWTRTSGVTTELHQGNLTEVVCGSSMEICPSGVTETYGPTTGLWASLLRIGAKLGYNAPNATILNPIKIESVANDHKVDQPAINGWGMTDMGGSGIKLESLGIYSGFTAAKLEVNGVALALNGLVCEPGIVKIEATGVPMPGCQFPGSDLTGARFDDADVQQCNFKGAVLDGASFVRAQAKNGLFVEAKLRRVNFEGADVLQGLFVGADLSEARLSKANLEQCMFMNATCAKADFSSSKLTFADFSNADIRHADFSGASVFRTRFHRVRDEGATFSKQPGALGDDADLAAAESFERGARK